MKQLAAFSEGLGRKLTITGLCWLGAWFLAASSTWAGAGLPVEMEVNLEQSTLVVGEPLVIDMLVSNTGGIALAPLTIGGGIFTRTWYLGIGFEGCEFPSIGVGSPIPPGRVGFDFSWQIFELQPGETVGCRVTLPQTFLPGREAISLYASTTIDGEFISEELAEFTYTLLPPSGIPVLVETALEHSIVMAGEPLAVDFQVTNLGVEPVGPVSVLSSEFSLAGDEGYVLEDCALGVTTHIQPSAGDGFSVEWHMPVLQPGEVLTCRAVFPQTLHPGEEQIRLSVLLEGETWEDEALFAYRIQPFVEPAFLVQVSPRQSTVVVGEPLDFELRVTNTSQEALTGLVLIGEPFFVVNVSFASLEGCEFFEDIQTEQYLFGWPPWQLDELRQGTRLVWWVPELAAGETATCHVTSTNTWRTGEDTVRLSAWRGFTPWRDLEEFSYAVLSELPPPTPVPVNSRVWLTLGALMLLFIGVHRLRALHSRP